jgi:hypothetical protein
MKVLPLRIEGQLQSTRSRYWQRARQIFRQYVFDSFLLHKEMIPSFFPSVKGKIRFQPSG